MTPIAEIPFLHALIPEGTAGLSIMQWMALVIGGLLIATRLPGLLFPKAYRKAALFAARGRPLVLRVAGAFLWIVALMILAVIVDTLPPLHSALLVIAVIFVAGGALILFFPEPYQRVAEKVLVVIPTFALRLISLVVVLLGFAIVTLSLSVH